MIVNTELTDDIQGKVLKISYIDKDGFCKIMNCRVTPEMMYNWRYATYRDTPDSNFLSWDFKRVAKKPSDNYLTVQRIHEIMVELNNRYPEIMAPLYELNLPKTAFCDIEVMVLDDGFPDAAHAKNPVNSMSKVVNGDVLVRGRANLSQDDINWIQKKIDDHCSAFKTKYKFSYKYYPREVDLVYDIVNEDFAKAECTTGWNFFGYDYPYIYNRAKTLGIDVNVMSPTRSFFKYTPQGGGKDDAIMLPNHRLMYDYMEIYAKWDRTVDPKESNKLDWVAGTVLGVKKLEHTLGFKEFWEQKPAEYICYNAIDSIVNREIDEKIRTSAAFMGLANLTHVPALTAFSSVKTLEIVQSEYLYKENRVMPQDRKADNPNKDGYEGAYVYDPIPGVYKNVFACDFRSLYPSIEMQFNISPDTYIKKDKNHKVEPNEIRTVSGAIYRRDFKGFIPTITEDFFKQRRAYKEEMQIAEHEMYELKAIYEKRFHKDY